MSDRVSGTETGVAPNQSVPHDRRLALDGTFNVRDVGGYPTRDGGLIRPRTLLRGDSLHQLTEPARSALRELGLRTIIDLRGEVEVGLWPNVFRASSTIAYHHVPLPNALLLHADVPPPLNEVYQAMLEHGRPALRHIFTILTRPAAWPALVHCTAGKDRTGVVIALLLGLAGASDETIVADYALSARSLTGDRFEAARLAAERHGFAWATSPELLACRPDTMRATLDYLQRSGGVDGYLRRLGLSNQQIRQLREALVEPMVSPGTTSSEPNVSRSRSPANPKRRAQAAP